MTRTPHVPSPPGHQRAPGRSAPDEDPAHGAVPTTAATTTTPKPRRAGAQRSQARPRASGTTATAASLGAGIPAAVRAAIAEHARAELPNEACGLLLLAGDQAVEYVAGENASPSPYFFELRLDPVAWADIGDRDLEQALLAVGKRRGAFIHHVKQMKTRQRFRDLPVDVVAGAHSTPPVAAAAEPL